MLPTTHCSACGPIEGAHAEGQAPCRFEAVEWNDGGIEWWEFCLLCGRMNS